MSCLARNARGAWPRTGGWLCGAGALAVVVGATPLVHGQYVVSGWNASRGGIGSDIQNGAGFAKLRSALVTNFGPVNFLGLPFLSNPLLISTNLLVLGVVFDPNTGVPVTPLSTAEQSVLTSFVTRGGRVLLVTESSAYQVTSQSMLNVLGLTSAGATVCTGDGTILLDPGTACPLQNGAFGVVEGAGGAGGAGSLGILDCVNGWYSGVGSGTVQGRWGYNSQPCIVRKTVGFGVAVCVSDAQLVDTTSPAGATLLQNILASLGAPIRSFASPQYVPCGTTTVTLSVSSAVVAPVYAWQKQVVGVWTNLADGDQANGTVIVGATTPVATISSAKASDARAYRCIITDACGSAVNSSAVSIIFATGCCPCAADYDASGGTPDAGDIEAYFTDWLAGVEKADSDCSGGTPDAGDIDVFFMQWLNGGC